MRESEGGCYRLPCTTGPVFCLGLSLVPEGEGGRGVNKPTFKKLNRRSYLRPILEKDILLGGTKNVYGEGSTGTLRKWGLRR